MKSNKTLLIGIILLVFVTAAITFFVSAFVFLGWDYLNPKYSILFNPEEVNIDNIRKFEQVRAILKNDFYEDVDENVLLEGAISGMTYSLDDVYTVYLSKEQMNLFMERSDGSYVGIGVSITMDTNGILTIVEPFEGSPAKKEGLLQGDKIIAVDGKDVTDIRDEGVIINMIKGKENTQVKITVFRPSEGKNIDFDIIRSRIKINNIKSEVLQGDIGYIRIVMFDSEIAEYFEEHLNKLIDVGIEGLIIDVRDNPGGSYDQVIKITDGLIPEGLIVYTEDKYEKRKTEKSDATELEIPMVVLINENSASASEILAGAVKDHEKGALIGAKSFGKGLVQEVKFLDDGSGIKVTIARYFTPSGICIHEKGIEPDISVEMDEEYKNIPVSQIPEGSDIQLQTAVEYLSR